MVPAELAVMVLVFRFIEIELAEMCDCGKECQFYNVVVNTKGKPGKVK